MSTFDFDAAEETYNEQREDELQRNRHRVVAYVLGMDTTKAHRALLNIWASYSDTIANWLADPTTIEADLEGGRALIDEALGWPDFDNWLEDQLRGPA